MHGLVKRLLLWSVGHPIWAAALFVALSTLAALQLPRLEIDESNEGLMLERDPARLYYDQVTATFGSDELTMVMVKGLPEMATPSIVMVMVSVPRSAAL